MAAMLKYLRIAVTALGLTACVLLMAMWVRSYWRHDQLICPWPNSRTLRVWSTPGHLTFLTHPKAGQWKLETTRVGKRFENQEGKIGWNSNAFNTIAYCPYWFPVPIPALLAVALWIKWRFSLRTLLIATTLVVVVLGIVAILH
jgi:hypothetical protein